MDAEVVSVGAELLLGATINTNAADCATALAEVGTRVVRVTTVGDEEPAIQDAVGAALERSRLVLVTGGLGPTRDDVTKRAVAALFGWPLVTDPRYLAHLEARWVARGRTPPMPAANHTQAEVPDGAQVLPNPRGSAPGLWLERGLGVAVLLPGVPEEMRGLLAEQVLPRLAARDRGAGERLHAHTIRTTGIPESALAALTVPARVTLAWLPSGHGVDLRVSAWGGDDAGRAVAEAAQALRAALGDACYGGGGDDLAALVLEELARRGLTLAVAESCTGGLLGARLTAVPGSSRAFLGGVIAYADAVKTSLLDVPPGLLASHGAVSVPVVEAMAAGAAARFDADAAVAVSGVAGPGGGTAERPVGTVCYAARVGPTGETRRVVLHGDRHAVRERAAQAALDLLRRLLATR